MEQEDEMGDLVLGKLSQVFITDPDLRDILSNIVLASNKMSCFEDEELLLIYSVIYSEKLEVQDERERKVFTLYKQANVFRCRFWPNRGYVFCGHRFCCLGMGYRKHAFRLEIKV